MNEFEAMDAPAGEASETAPAPHFVTQTALTAELQLEATRAARGKYGKWLIWACAGILLVLLGFTVWQCVLSPSVGNLLFLAAELLLGAYIVYANFFGQKAAMKKWQRQIQNRYDTNALHLTCEFYDLTFVQTVRETGNELDCGYSSIEAIEETAHSYLLRCGKSRWFFVEKAGLEQPEAFRAFLREKCGC